MSDPIVIGIDGRSMVREPTGVGRYVKNLLPHLVALDPGIRFRVFLPRRADARVGQAEVVHLGMPARGLLGRLDNILLWNHVRLPLHLVRRPVNLFHGPFYTLPWWCPFPAVVTIHDITFDLHPEWFTTRARFAFRFARASALKARHVLTVSECSRRDIMSRYGLPSSRVTSVPLAPDPEFARVADTAELERVSRKYGLRAPFFLHVGSITPRRNIDRILEAFAAVRMRHPELTLAIVGRVEPSSEPLGPAIARRGLEDAVRATGYADAGDLPALYSAARAVLYVSLYEGFGLPVLEAMACGAPVVGSRTSSIPEVAGDAALLVDPLDTAAIGEALTAIHRDGALRSDLAARGPMRASRFSWRRTAEGTLDVYRRALYSLEGPA